MRQRIPGPGPAASPSAAAFAERRALALCLGAMLAVATTACGDDGGSGARDSGMIDATELPGMIDAAELPDGPPTVEIGTGMFAFEPLVAGQELDLIAGPQGGYHFILHARMRGMKAGDPRRLDGPENPTTLFAVEDASGRRVDIVEVRNLGYEDSEEPMGWKALPSGRIVRVYNNEVDALYGELVTLIVEVRDIDGRSASNSIQIRPIPYP